jgi:hypothetical protein
MQLQIVALYGRNTCVGTPRATKKKMRRVVHPNRQQQRLQLPQSGEHPPVRTTASEVRTPVILLFCLAALMWGNSARMLPHLRSALDRAACCGRELPITRNPFSSSRSTVRSITGHSDTSRQQQQQQASIQQQRDSAATTVAGVDSSSSSMSACLRHEPVQVEILRKTAHNVANTSRLLQQPSAERCGRLKRSFWYTGYNVTSTMAQSMEQQQSNCTIPVVSVLLDNANGIGSQLHVWSQLFCNANQVGYRIRTVRYDPEWLWLDQTYCETGQRNKSPLLCYFPAIENRCGIEPEQVHTVMTIPEPKRLLLGCNTTAQKRRQHDEDGNDAAIADLRAGAIEYMFQNVSNVLVQEAERQIGLLFGTQGAPTNLITVHIRWGDKFFEMDLVPIEQYIHAIQRILDRRGNTTHVHIYLASEDPWAVSEFQNAALAHWNVYVDRTVLEMDPYRPSKGNRASWTTRNTRGRAGLVALASLLVAMEAVDYVLTTGSNWSRLMNELRTNVVDVHCANCTTMIDLRPGQW